MLPGVVTCPSPKCSRLGSFLGEDSSGQTQDIWPCAVYEGKATACLVPEAGQDDLMVHFGPQN